MKFNLVKACLGIVMLVSLVSCDKRVTVTYDLNYEGSTPIIERISAGKIAPMIDDPVREGYSFINWFTTPASGEVYFDFGSPLDNDTTLYARWLELIPVWTITFDLNYSGSTNITQKITDGNAAFKVATPTRDNYVFRGWFLDKNTWEIPFVFENSIEESMIVYAFWSTPSSIIDINSILAERYPGTGFPTFDQNQIAALSYNKETTSISLRSTSSRIVFEYLDKFDSWSIRKLHNSYHLQDSTNKVEGILQYNQHSNILDLEIAKISNFPKFELSRIYPAATIFMPALSSNIKYETVSFLNDTRRYSFSLINTSESDVGSLVNQLTAAGWTRDTSLTKIFPQTDITFLDPNNRVIIVLEAGSNKIDVTYVPNVYNKSNTYSAVTRLEIISGYDLSAIPEYTPISVLSQIDSSPDLSFTKLTLPSKREFKIIGEIKIPYLYYINKVPDLYRETILEAGFQRVSDIPHTLNANSMWLSPAGTFQPYYLIESSKQISEGAGTFDEIYLTILGIEETPESFRDIYSFLEVQTGLNLETIQDFGVLGTDNFVYSVGEVVLPTQSRTILPIVYGYDFTYNYPTTDFHFTFLSKLLEEGFVSDPAKSHMLPGTTNVVVYCFNSPSSVRFSFDLYYYADDDNGVGNISFVSN